GLTMVSNLKYYSFKTINLKKSVPFVAIFLIVLFVALLSYQPPLVLFAAFVAYGISGYVVSGWLMLRARRTRAAHIGGRRRRALRCSCRAAMKRRRLRRSSPAFALHCR